MRCGACGREVDGGPGDLCPVCGGVLGADYVTATPESSLAGFGKVVRGIRPARRRSRVVRAGALAILLPFAAASVAWGYQVWQNAGGRLTLGMAMPALLLLLTGAVAFRWLR
ncbi:hydrogenase maturation nickel metallochaperone HypA [Symbiobacterium thermophilum]|nr:hydrogenase maturation nickel metallochaperone HypA [Symbiobacterium thermophilum]